MNRDFLFALPVLLAVGGFLGWLRLGQPRSLAAAERAPRPESYAESQSAERIATLDVQPRTRPNEISLAGLGIVPVALVASPEFDVLEVNPLTLVLGRADRTHGAVAPVSLDEIDWTGPAGAGRDGRKDLYLVFSKRALVRELALGERFTPNPVLLELRGRLRDGTSFVARDELNLLRGDGEAP